MWYNQRCNAVSDAAFTVHISFAKIADYQVILVMGGEITFFKCTGMFSNLFIQITTSVCVFFILGIKK